MQQELQGMFFFKILILMYFRSQEDGRCLQGLVRPPVTFVKKECADLFSAHFSSISPFKEGRVQRRPFKLGLLVCSHTGLALQCF